jgi:hypothetical protein
MSRHLGLMPTAQLFPVPRQLLLLEGILDAASIYIGFTTRPL